jgi:hypothetical protein
MAYMLFFNGLFNQMFLGVACYHWIMFGLFLVGIVVIALWYFLFWFKLKPYHGVFRAHFRKTGASLVFDENMHFDLITDRSAKVIFNETFKQAQEAEDDKTEAPAATIGRVSVDFIFDPDKWTYPNSFQHKIIEDVAERWNLVNPGDQIRTLIKFSRYLEEGRFTDEESLKQLEKIKHTFYVPWSRIQMMYPKRKESDLFGFVMSLAKIIQDMKKNSLNDKWWIPVAFFGLIDVAMIIGHFIRG